MIANSACSEQEFETYCRMRFLQTTSAILLLSTSCWARYEAALIKEYNGSHQESFFAQYDRVRLLTRQAQLEVSSRLGLLEYKTGFASPLLIRFDDGAPGGMESALAYVRLSQSEKGLMQELVVNLDAMHSMNDQFDAVFMHEMTHAVMNDAVGGDAAMKIPHWVQEGLAQFVTDQGMTRVKEAAGRYKKSQVHALLFKLDGPFSGYAYPQYFLAIEAMHELHSINAVQAMVRNLVVGKPVVAAVEDAAGCSWDDFQKEVRDYSLKIFQEYARPDLEIDPF